MWVLFEWIIKDMQAHPVTGCQGCTSNSSFYKELPYLMRSHQGRQGAFKHIAPTVIHWPISSYIMAIPSIALHTLDSDKSWPKVGDSLLIHALKSVLIHVIDVTCHLWSCTLKSKIGDLQQGIASAAHPFYCTPAWACGSFWKDLQPNREMKVQSSAQRWIFYFVSPGLVNRSFLYQHVQRTCGASGMRQHQHALPTPNSEDWTAPVVFCKLQKAFEAQARSK